MSQKDKPNHLKNMKFFRFRMPKFSIWVRLLLYIVMISSAVLALVNVSLECFSVGVGIACYVLAACTLFPGMYYLVFDIRDGYKAIRDGITPRIEANPYAKKVTSDFRMRTVVSTVPGLTINVIFAIVNGVTGLLTHSAWFGSLSAYYILLALMRFGAVRQDRIISNIDDSQERMKKEDAIYRRNSILFILLAVVLAGMVVLLEFEQGGKKYPGIMIYVVAMYTFYRVIMAFISMAKDRKRNSPLLTIILKIDFVDAFVSVLTLQTAMFAAFAAGGESFINLMNLLTGSGVCLIVLAAGIQGIVLSKKRNRA